MKKVTLLAVMFTLAMICGGCTGSLDWQAHYPGKYNAVDQYQTRPATVYYKGYVPPFPMDEPTNR